MNQRYSSRNRLAPLIIMVAAAIGMGLIYYKRFKKLQEGAPTATGASLRRYAYSNQLMGTQVRLVVYSRQQHAAERAMALAFASLRRIDELMSSYKPDSELARINRLAAVRSVGISAVTRDVISRGLAVSRLSGGAFDMTVRPLIELWRSCASRGVEPTDEQLSRALAVVGYGHVRLDAEACTIRFDSPGVRLDLGGIAKGYAIDQAIEVLKQQGIAAGMVDVGGDLACFGRPGKDSDWLIGLQNPFGKGILHKIRLTDSAVATSGHYRRFFQIGPRRYSHIIDPRSGRPAQQLASVTVIAPEAVDADALATAVSVMGLKKGMELIEQLEDVEALIVTGEPGAVQLHRSSGFSRYEPEQSERTVAPSAN